MQRWAPQSLMQLQPCHPDNSLQPRTGMSQLLPQPGNWHHSTTPLVQNQCHAHWMEGTPSPHKSLPSTCPSNDVRRHQIMFDPGCGPSYLLQNNPVLARTRTPLLYVVYKRIYYGEKPWSNESETITNKANKFPGFNLIFIISSKVSLSTGKRNIWS